MPTSMMSRRSCLCSGDSADFPQGIQPVEPGRKQMLGIGGGIGIEGSGDIRWNFLDSAGHEGGAPLWATC